MAVPMGRRAETESWVQKVEVELKDHESHESEDQGCRVINKGDLTLPKLSVFRIHKA